MHLNLLSFEPVSETTTINLYTEKVENSRPLIVYKDECPELWEHYPEVLGEYKSLYCSFSNEEEVCCGDKFSVTINLNNAPRFALHYFRYLLYTYFLGRVSAVSYDFVDGIEVWVKAPQQPNSRYTEFHKYLLNPQYKRISTGFELLLSYNGISRALNMPVTELNDIDQTILGLVILNGELSKFKYLTPKQKQNIEKTYPVLNTALNRVLNITENRYINSNKYKTTLSHLNTFCKQHLFTDELNQLSISKEFITVPEENIDKVSGGSKDLLFAGDSKHMKPFDGMKEFGPYQPPTNNHVQFFFIYQKEDLHHVKIYHDIFSKGLIKTYKDYNTGKEMPFKAFKSLSEYIKQPYSTEPNSSIAFTSLDTAVAEIKQALATKPMVKGCTYVAIYISPLNRNDQASEHYGVYFQIKELLLDKGITSQVIYKERHNDEFFSYHLPNIEIALLAKIGGIPWRLNSTQKNDLIVGVGAFRSESIGKRYVGSAFSFTKEGLFENLDCYRDNDLDHLVSDIRKALMHYVVENEKAERLIIHYYKTMRKKDSQRISDMLFRLGLQIPVIIVTINKTESDDVFGFNPEAEDLMPISGTIVRFDKSQFLLFNSAKYNEGFKNDKGKKDYHFPIKIKINSVSESYNITMPIARELLDQIYQFSRMYWKSVSQQNLPITIKYPEMVAEIVPHFSDAELPQFGKSNLWFL
ncbi:MAG: hypothetical protein BGO29_12760 [Bacteroidales bacterium 36-12]|jgi:hypothetical protein|nr:MAG: hypothetical protein BGO29_12760 [Bacteroidales bacterium 36-12]